MLSSSKQLDIEPSTAPENDQDRPTTVGASCLARGSRQQRQHTCSRREGLHRKNSASPLAAVVEPAGRSVATVRIVHCQHIRGAVQVGACSGARTVRSFPEHKWTASSFFRPPPLTWGIAEPNETKRCSSRLRFSPVTSRISQDKALSTTALGVRRANGTALY